jgi:hypothetical protein
MKTFELTGAALDWAVWACEKPDDAFLQQRRKCRPYSTSWNEGGPIIERERIELCNWAIEGWEAKATSYQFLNTPNERAVFAAGSGPTPLIAAMRCYVASKCGESIQVPEGLE